MDTATVISEVEDCLDENDKRWLACVACFQTVIVPVLKDYIRNVASGFYEDLVDKKRIHLQEYPDVLIEYNFFPLQYWLINENNRFGFKQNKYSKSDRSSWNYKVVNSVDLTKLFMSYDKSTYTEFSECDASELIAIISNIDVFPSKVRKIISEILEKVRHPAAHYRNQEWENKKFEESLETMENLIKYIDITEDTKSRTICKIRSFRENKMFMFLKGVPVSFSIEQKECTDGYPMKATVHGLNKSQERAAIRNLSKAPTEETDCDINVKNPREGSLELDLTADPSIFESPKRFKNAVYKLLNHVIKAAGVNKESNTCLDVELILPDSLSKEQLDVVSVTFPDALKKRRKKIDEQLDVVSVTFPDALKKRRKKIDENIKKDAWKWSKIRNETLPKLVRIEEKLTEAGDSLKTYRMARNIAAFMVVGLGAALIPFTGGISFGAATATIGGISLFYISFIFEHFLTCEVMMEAQLCIDEDIKQTIMLRKHVRFYMGIDEYQADSFTGRLHDNFPGAIINNLNKSLRDFLISFINSEYGSVFAARDAIHQLKEELRFELQMVENL